MQINKSNGYDYTWKNPCEAQLAVIDIISMMNEKTTQSRMLCDFIIFANESPWFIEIKRYADGMFIASNESENVDTFIQGCKNIVKLVENGYDEQEKRWYYLGDLEDNASVIEINKFLFMIANSLLVIQEGFSKERVSGLFVISIETFASIILGKEWRKNFYDAVAESKKSIKAKGKHNGKTA
jgi:hypothetical protein